MASASDTISDAIGELDRLRTILKKSDARQVYAQEERSLAKATAMAWFNDHRAKLAALGAGDLGEVDAFYQRIIDASDRGSARSTYFTCIKRLREALIAVRASTLKSAGASRKSYDNVPDFSQLTSDQQMQAILNDRWAECVTCIAAGAPLAATVMMGGLLETLLMGRVNLEKDKSRIFKAQAAPKDNKTGKPRPLGEWMLKDYISVAHELKWITVSTKQIAEVLRDFRNYIHPHKQLAHNVRLSGDDAALLWEVSKNIAVQVLKSCSP